MTNIAGRARELGGLICIFAAVFVACERVPDYCGKGKGKDAWLYDGQFCFGDRAYNLCGGEKYNPLAEGCVQDAVGARCLDGSAVPSGTPCGGYILMTAATPEIGGRVTSIPEGPAYAAGQRVVLSAVPDSGYTFAGWAGADTSKAYTVTVTMDANKPLVAMFRPKDELGASAYALITTAFPEIGGAVVRSPNAESYGAGTAVTVTASPAAGYTFDGWSGASASKDADVTITMDGSKTLVAMFTPIAHTITVNANPETGGAVFVNGTALAGAVSQNFGATLEAWAIPADGYVFKGWSGDAVGGGAENPVAISLTNSGMTLTANFQRGGVKPATPPDTAAEKPYIVTVINGATGMSVSGAYAAGAAVTVSAGSPPAGQRFKNWTTASADVVFADSNRATTMFIMPGHDVAVTANFTRDPAGGGGANTFTDGRNGKTYNILVINGKTWMAENLSYAADGSLCRDCGEYGVKYDWEAAMAACPFGWHLPTYQEWEVLVSIAGGWGAAGAKLKAAVGWGGNGGGTDDYGFSALPDGCRRDGVGDTGGCGGWWTATEYGVGGAFYLNMFGGEDAVSNGSGPKSLEFSVRCLAD